MTSPLRPTGFYWVLHGDQINPEIAWYSPSGTPSWTYTGSESEWRDDEITVICGPLAPPSDFHFSRVLNTETIEAAAILHDGEIYSVPRPGRHHDVIQLMAAEGFDAGAMVDQGFLTSRGRFVRREEALDLAVNAKQLRDAVPRARLYSEDLW